MKSSRRSSPIQMNEFSLAVISWVKKIPRGRVATYGQIARLAGKPHGARGVGWILHSCAESHDLPWQRVLNSQGRISFSPKSSEFREQRKLLEKEGVEFLTDRALDLKAYQWSKEPTSKTRGRRTPSMFE